VDTLEILWPSGVVTKLEKIAANQIITVQEGRGIVARPFPRVPDR
jgi:ASPIC and UnbV